MANSFNVRINSDDEIDLAERGNLGDKEEAIKLFQGIFGERNVFVKDE